MFLLVIGLLGGGLAGAPAWASDWVTKRFGEASTCNVTGVARDAKVDSADANAVDGASKTLYYRYTTNGLLFSFDLSAIPKGAAIRRAVLRFFFDYDYDEGGKSGVTQPLYRVSDPDASGAWDEAAVSFKNKRAGVPWSARGGLDTALGDQVGSVYFKNWDPLCQGAMEAEVTAVAQFWVNNPAQNLGLYLPSHANFNKRIAAKEYDNPKLRPYLEVTYAGAQDAAPPAPTALRAVHYQGQTFLTWTEAKTGKNETSYRIYRSSQPITAQNLDQAEPVDQVLQGSSWLSDSAQILQPDLSPAGVTLAVDSGLYVLPVESTRQTYYAVTTVVEGNENRSLAAGANATTQAVSEKPGLPGAFFFRNYYYYDGYVMWLGRYNPADPADQYGFDNRRSAPFFFSISKPDHFDAQRAYPLTVYLHAWSHNYFDSGEGHDNSLYVDAAHQGGFCLGINDQPRVVARDASGALVEGTYLEVDGYGHSFYAGWNSNYVPTYRLADDTIPKSFAPIQPFEQGVNVPYTEKAIAFLIDWLRQSSPWAGNLDPQRVYATGSSMGGSGALALALHYPDKIAAANSVVGRVTPYIASLGQYGHSALRLLGTVEMNLPLPDGRSMYDYLDLAKYVAANPGRPYPPLRMLNGKNDTTIVWPQFPPFYPVAGAARLGLLAHFNQRDHSTTDPDANFIERVDERQFVATQDQPWFNLFHYRLAQPYVAFSDCTLDDHPGSGTPTDGDPRGGLNRFPNCDLETIVDTAARFEATVYLWSHSTASTASVTLTPRRLQNLAHAPGARLDWKRVRSGQTLQSGQVTADANGLVSIPGFVIEQTPAQLVLTVAGATSTPTPTPTPSATPTATPTPTPTPASTATPAPTPTPTPTGGSTLAPSKYIIEHVQNVPLAQSTHQLFPAPGGVEPARGASFIDSSTGHRITRISDVGDIEGIDAGYAYDGNPGRGMHNGYSKYTNVNQTGEYVIAYGVQPWINGLYRLSDGAYVKWLKTGSGAGLGETFDVRWDLSGAAGTQYTIYYATGNKLYSQDVLAGPSSEKVLYTFAANVVSEGHMDQSTDARYRGVALNNGTTVVIDMKQHKLLPVIFPAKAMFDISPTGAWFRFDADIPNRFYRTSDLATSDTTKYVELPTTDHGHDGWAYDRNGQEVYVFQDNKTDWFSAFNPATGERTNILNMAETGWGFGQHMGRIVNPAKKGWLLMAAYTADNTVWPNNQIMLIEIKPAEQQPRIWRIASNFNLWNLGSKGDSYFAEAFASIDPSGNNIYWGSNWMGQDNLELYRVELPADWHDVLSGSGPTPTPTPTPTLTPTPTPTATPTITPTPTPGLTATPMPAPVLKPVAGKLSAPALQVDYADTVSAPPGAWVTLWGISFGAERGASQVTIGDTPATDYAAWTDTRIDFRVPAAASTGALAVRVGDGASNTLDFTVRPGQFFYVRPAAIGASDDGPGSFNQPWYSLAKAAATARAGDTVYLAESVYPETLEPLHGGQAGLPILFKALPGHQPQLDGSTLAGTPDGLRLDGGRHPGLGYLIFSGLTLRHYAQSIQMVQGAHHCNFYDLDVGQGEGGLFLYGVNDAFVAQCRFHHNAKFGVVFNNYASNIYVRDCVSHDNAASEGGGFEADSSTSNVTIYRCQAYDNTGDGFDLRVDGLLLNECAAWGNLSGMHLWRNAHVQNSLVYANQQAGIICDRLPEATEPPSQEVVNCTVAGPHAGAGVMVHSGVGIVIRNTISVGGLGPAVSFDDAYTSLVIENSILQTAAGEGAPVLVWGAAGKTPKAFSASAVANGQFAAQTGQPDMLAAGVAPSSLFKDYATGLLTLQIDSAARGAGTPIKAPKIDFFREPRGLVNGMVDVGAYEYPADVSAASTTWAQYE